MNFSLNTTGFDKLQDALTKYSQAVTDNVKDVIAKSANDIAEAAKGNTSEQIADTITTEISDDGLSATISANSQQAIAAEYGLPEEGSKKHSNKTAHHKHPEHTKPHKEHNKTPKPFLNPAFEENRQNIIDSIAQTLTNDEL